MATLQNNGGCLWIKETLTQKKAYCANGKILINRGNGWKRFAHIKEGLNIGEVIAKRKFQEEKSRQERIAWWTFRDAFHSMVSFKSRYMVFEMLTMLSNDTDGFWVELQDAYNLPKLDIEDCVKLCQLFDRMEREVEEIKLAQKAFA